MLGFRTKFLHSHLVFVIVLRHSREFFVRFFSKKKKYKKDGVKNFEILVAKSRSRVYGSMAQNIGLEGNRFFA